MMASSSNLTILLLLPWAALWLAGGYWLTHESFRLPAGEEWMVAVAIGCIMQNWLVNFLARVIPIPLAFWAAALVVFVSGALLAGLRSGWHSLLRLPAIPLRVLAWQSCVFLALVLLYFAINRGMAIFDDFAHLPTVSTMAAGDIPPHFALDPAVPMYYHYFLLLFSVQAMRIAGLAPWVALDVGRAVSFGTSVMLSALFARRLTRSTLGGVLGGMMVAFGSGTRWLLLLFPPALTAWLGRNVEMIGSGAGSGETLPQALVSTWAVEGAGPIGFPFAFANGVYPAGAVLGLTVIGLTGFSLIFLLLLTFHRWRSGSAAVLSAVLISVWGLLGEAELAGIAAGWALVTLGYLWTNKTLRLPRTLWTWLGVVAAGGLIALFEGGAWTEVITNIFHRLSGAAPVSSYQTIGFALAWPPALVSSHLGVLPLFDPSRLVVALLEAGPVLLVLPLLAAWGRKAFRLQRWYEAATAATALVMLLMLFIQFNGSTGVRNTPRLYVFLPILAAFAVPLAWIWAAHRGPSIRAAAAALGLTVMLGGTVMFGVELLAIQRPVYSTFISPLDARMFKAHWNRLPPGSLVFDPQPDRAPTILGLATDSSYTWYQTKPGWDVLRQDPVPTRLTASGYRYFYLDNQYWDEISVQARQALSSTCVQVIDEVSDGQGAFRRLLDLQNCR